MNDTTMAAIAPASVNGVAIGADAIRAESVLYHDEPDAIASCCGNAPWRWALSAPRPSSTTPRSTL